MRDTRRDMAEIRFLNTLTGCKDPFLPLHPPEVRIYTCGPTVYDFAHIGNFRTFVFQDILRKFLKHRGFRVIQVMNLTDVDDRIIENARARGLGIREYTERYIQAFLEDRRALSLEEPEHLVRATDHIDAMVALIKRLTGKSVTYTSDGSIYFRIAKFPEYGKLSKVDMSGIQPGARVESDRYDKADVRDFALWKAPKPGEHFWETPIGPGRPGWHIECSAMAMQYLGETLDIHTGGIDLAFPHHENEIAQSEAATGRQFVRYWLHAEHLNVEGEKMSKSLGNFFTVRELLEQGQKPSAIRFLLASVPYRSRLTFSREALTQAAASIDRLRNLALRLRTERFPAGKSLQTAARIAEGRAGFERGLEDDLNTAQALAAWFDLVRDVNTWIDRGQFQQEDAVDVLAVMEEFDTIFSVLVDNDAAKLRTLGIGGQAPELTDAEIEAMANERQDARKHRDFKRADEIRKHLEERGIILEDTREGGLRWKRKG